MNSDTILILGYGAMASAIAQGLNGKYSMEICGRDRRKALDFIAKLDLQNTTAPESKSVDFASNPHAINIQDKILLLCVKPYALASFAYLGQAKAVYSVLAGISIEQIATHIHATAYVRLMPNIAALHGLSATTAFCSVGAASMISAQEKREPHMDLPDSQACSTAVEQTDSLSQQLEQLKCQAQEICQGFGEVVFVENERLIDSSIATSGSAPAFLALVAQALVDSGVMVGLSRVDSRTLVAQTFVGVGELLRHYSPQELIDRVTTPGGTTIEGLAVLESSGVRGAFMQAAKASVAKASTTNAPNHSCASAQPHAPTIQNTTDSQKTLVPKEPNHE